LKRFSERHSFKPMRSALQLDAMDDALRNSLWNALDVQFLSRARDDYSMSALEIEGELSTKLWLYYFKVPLDEMPLLWRGVKKFIRNYFFKCTWFEVYDFIEFVACNYRYETTSEKFRTTCNGFLESELSGYRFVGELIAPITSKEESEEIEETLELDGNFVPVTIHISKALELFADRKAPDYRNSIKESISAVEAISNLIADKDNASLGEALKIITDKLKLHPSLYKAFSSLYGYTSNAEGIRHALLGEPNLDSEDAKFMLIACSAFINYLKVKTSKAGICLT
jgi:hypothetical protein